MKVKVKVLIAVLLLFVVAGTLQAGNADRAGQAGATELLINPWARSSGWWGVNSANIRGVESIMINPAGVSHIKRTEVVFSRTDWLSGSDIAINSFGIVQALKHGNVLGFTIMAFDLGDFIRTTVNEPEGIGTFKPQYINASATFARAFSDYIFGAGTIRFISEAIPDVSAFGIALDAGIQYQVDENAKFKFGIALKNVGPPMKFTGEGMTQKVTLEGQSQNQQSTVYMRSQKFEIPSLLNVGVSYRFDIAADHKVFAAANFTSNTFTKDQIGGGLEYWFRSFLAIRGGFNYEKGIFSKDERTNAFTGFAGGATVELPFNKHASTDPSMFSTFALDYSYRPTDPFSGTHSIGVRLNL